MKWGNVLIFRVLLCTGVFDHKRVGKNKEVLTFFFRVRTSYDGRKPVSPSSGATSAAFHQAIEKGQVSYRLIPCCKSVNRSFAALGPAPWFR